MENTSPEMALMEPEEREEVEFIWNLIPAEDRKGIRPDDVLYVLDKIDDFMEENGLMEYEEDSEEAVYSDAEIDETEQLEYILAAAKADQRPLTAVQIQLILDGELQYGISQGWYVEED